LGGGIKIGSELSESSDLSVMGELKFEGTSNLFHSFNLSS